MKKTFALSLLTLALAACGPSSQQVQPVYQAAPQVQQLPPVYQQAPVVVQQHDNSAANLVAGVALGAMLSNGSRGPSTTVIQQPQSSTVTNNTVIREKVIIREVPRPVAAAPAPAARPAPVAARPSPAPAPRAAPAPTPARATVSSPPTRSAPRR